MSTMFWCTTGADIPTDAMQVPRDLRLNRQSDNTATSVLNKTNFVTTQQPLTGTAKLFWPNGSILKVAFTNGTEEQRDRVLRIASEWSNHANIQFHKVEDSTEQRPDIRVSFDQDRHSSEIGTRASIEVRAGRPSMKFVGFAPGRGTVLHEFGHALGLRHEHQNPVAGIKWDKDVVYKEFQQNHGWDKARVNSNVFNQLSKDSTNYSRFDPQSIMVYNIPSHWTTDGFSTARGSSLSPLDISYISDWYPFGGASRASKLTASRQLRVLTRGISKQLFEQTWNGQAWDTPEKWSLALPGRLTGHPGTSDWYGAGETLSVVARRERDGAPMASDFSGGRWSAWTGLGGGIGGSPLVLRTGRTEWCFVRGVSDTPFYKRRDNGAAWSPKGNEWTSLGGAITGSISGDVERNLLVLAVRGRSGQAAIKWRSGQNWGPGERAWIGLKDDITAQPAIAIFQGKIHVVARFSDGVPHHLIYDWKRRHSALNWQPLPINILGSPTLVRGQDNQLHLLVRSVDRATIHRTFDGKAWSNWQSLGGRALDSPTAIAISNTDNRSPELHVFVTGTSRQGFHKLWNAQRWLPSQSRWTRLGGQLDWSGV